MRWQLKEPSTFPAEFHIAMKDIARHGAGSYPISAREPYATAKHIANRFRQFKLCVKHFTPGDVAIKNFSLRCEILGTVSSGEYVVWVKAKLLPESV